MAQAIAISRPELPSRDITDTSHIKIKSTTDVKVLRDAIGRYGRLPGETMPGGIVTEGEAQADVQLHSVSICREEPQLLLINNRFYFDTGVDAEEVALIWHAVLHTGQAAKDFGVLSQWKAIGINNDTIVARTMMEADNALGATVYGFDSQYRLGPPPSPTCPNPFVEEARIAAEDPKVAEKLLLNFLHRLYPQFFLTIKDVIFTAGANRVFQVASSNVVAAIGVLTADGTLATTHGESLAPTLFPLVHRALDELVSEFSQYAAGEPNIARTIAYGELVALLRLAARDGASLEGDDLVRRLLENRKSVALPRFNYTVRSPEFAEVATAAARKLSQNVTVWFEGFIASLVAVHYAMQAGDFDLFLRCKKKALGLIDHINGNKLGNHCHLIDVLPELKEKLSRSCHDNLIPNLFGAACNIGATSQEKQQYLESAVALCRTRAEENSPTFCRLIEAKRYLDSPFDPIPELAKARRLDPTSMEPFYTLARIRGYEKRLADGDRLNTGIEERIEILKGELRFHQLPPSLKETWTTYQPSLSYEQAFALLSDLQRFGLSLVDFLPATREHKEPLQALWYGLAARLMRLPEDSFSMQLVHSGSPFSMAHELLDHETPENLDGLYKAIPLGIEPWSMLSPKKRGPIKRLRSAFSKEDAGQWWNRFVRRHSSSTESNASKIAILLLHELKVRKSTVYELHRQMRLHKTKNPQAGLFLIDLNQAKFDAISNKSNEGQARPA